MDRGKGLVFYMFFPTWSNRGFNAYWYVEQIIHMFFASTKRLIFLNFTT